MAKNHTLPVLLFLAAVCLCGLSGSRVLTASSPPGDERQVYGDEWTRTALIRVARGELGVQEVTARNDGPQVAAYLRYTGLAPGHEWCAAFVSWCYGQAGLPEPRTPWSPALFPARRVVWRGGAGSAGSGSIHSPEPGVPRPGDVFGLWILEKGRIGHAGLIEHWEAGGAWCLTIEGNSHDRVERRRRHPRTIHVVADWVSGNGKGGRP